MFSYEEEPMGTAGALAHCKDKLLKDDESCHIVVINGDVMCNFPLERMLDNHKQFRKDVTMLVKDCAPNSDMGK